MRFITSSLSRCKARIGKLCEFEKKPDLVLETPLLLLYTRRGCVPHLTKDVLQTVVPDPHMLSVSLPNSINMLESIKEFDSFSEFTSMQEYPIFLSVQDPAELTDPCNHKQHIISVWTKQGRVRLTSDSYMDVVKAYKPDIYSVLCDGDTDVNSSNKRLTHAVDKSSALLDKCLKIHEELETMKNIPVVGAIEGGYSLTARENCIKHLINKPLCGYIIDGMHKNGPDVVNIDYQMIETIVKHSINVLPEDKLRITMGCYSPKSVLHLVELGVDVFDSSYAYIMTEQAKALLFLCSSQSEEPKDFISVTDKKYADDFSPLSKSCECLTCKEYSRAYINHLFLTKELLGPVLLMAHNLHTYTEFFKRIRHHIKEGTFDDFKLKVSSAFTTKASDV